jgi:hypothetical protein
MCEGQSILTALTGVLFLAGGGGDRLDGGKGYDGASHYGSKGVRASLDKSIAGTGEALGDTFVSVEMLEGSNTGAVEIVVTSSLIPLTASDHEIVTL